MLTQKTTLNRRKNQKDTNNCNLLVFYSCLRVVLFLLWWTAKFEFPLLTQLQSSMDHFAA